MNLKEKNQGEKSSLWNFTIDAKCALKKGDIVKILDDKGDTLEYAYLLTDVTMMHGMPIVNLKTQRTNQTIEMVVTSAIQKI
jgi:hypothetical protein